MRRRLVLILAMAEIAYAKATNAVRELETLRAENSQLRHQLAVVMEELSFCRGDAHVLTKRTSRQLLNEPTLVTDLTGNASQSSILDGSSSHHAIDGNTSSCTSTKEENRPWWKLTFPIPVQIERVEVWNDESENERLKGALIKVDGQSCGGLSESKQMQTVQCGGKSGSAVWIRLPSFGSLHLCAVKVYGPSKLYKLATSWRCGSEEITEITECDHAAVALGLADTIAEDDERKKSSSKPGGCYFDSKKLKMNVDGTNTGYCSLMRPCLCRQPTLVPTMYPTFVPTDTVQLSSETPTVVPTTRFPTTRTPTLPNYLLVDSGSCIAYISSAQDCWRAAAEMQLSDWCRRSQRKCNTDVQEDGKHGSLMYPRGCYFRNVGFGSYSLMMNVDGTNRAKCSRRMKCLCKSAATHAPAVVTKPPTRLTTPPTLAPTFYPTSRHVYPSTDHLKKRCNLTGTLTVEESADIMDIAKKLKAVHRKFAFRLTHSSDLQSDIVIPAGVVVFLDGGGATIKTRNHQFFVTNSAKLCLYNLNLVDGTRSAIVLQDAGNSTMLDMAWVTISNMRTETEGAALSSYGRATLSIFQVKQPK